MQTTSSLYKSILSGTHWFETSVAIGEPGRLITEDDDVILFGGMAILVARSGADAGYQQDRLKSVKITRSLFSGSEPEIGACVSAEIDVELLEPKVEIPRMAQVVPYVRATNGTETSEWIQKGVFYIDTREIEDDRQSAPILKIHGYDSMLLAEQDFPSTTNVTWPTTDKIAVQLIADALGVSVDSRTWEIITNGYAVQYPGTDYSCREILGFIAAMYCGNFVFTDTGDLLLVQLNGIPKETNYLMDNTGYAITFGGDRILV